MRGRGDSCLSPAAFLAALQNLAPGHIWREFPECLGESLSTCSRLTSPGAWVARVASSTTRPPPPIVPISHGSSETAERSTADPASCPTERAPPFPCGWRAIFPQATGHCLRGQHVCVCVCVCVGCAPTQLRSRRLFPSPTVRYSE